MISLVKALIWTVTRAEDRFMVDVASMRLFSHHRFATV